MPQLVYLNKTHCFDFYLHSVCHFLCSVFCYYLLMFVFHVLFYKEEINNQSIKILHYMFSINKQSIAQNVHKADIHI